MTQLTFPMLYVLSVGRAVMTQLLCFVYSSIRNMGQNTEGYFISLIESKSQIIIVSLNGESEENIIEVPLCVSCHCVIYFLMSKSALQILEALQIKIRLCVAFF